MIPIKKIFFGFYFLLITSFVFPQQDFIKDSVEIIPYLLRGEQIYNGNLDSASVLWKKGLELTKTSIQKNAHNKNRMNKLKAVFYNDLGYSELMYGRTDKARLYFDSCMAIQIELKLWDQYALALNNVANIYLAKGQYKEAVEIFSESISIYKKNKLFKELPRVYCNIALAYQQSGDYTKAVEYFFESEKLADIHRPKDKSEIYLNISQLFILENDTVNFLKYNNKAIVNSIYNSEWSSLAYAYHNLGKTYSIKNKALMRYYYLKAFEIRKRIKDLNGMANSLYNLACTTISDTSAKMLNESKRIYLETGNIEGSTFCDLAVGASYERSKNYELAEKLYLQSYEKFKQLNAVDGIKNSCTRLYTFYKLINQPHAALKYFEEGVRLKDSLSNFDLRKQTLQHKISNEYEKKENILVEEHHLKEELLKKEEENQKIVIYFITSVLFVVFLFSLWILRSLRFKKKANVIILQQKEEVEKQKETIEEKQKEIIDSINYAKRLQEAIMPTEDYVKMHLEQSFVLYKPKDIVAGDFYWIESVSSLKVGADLIFIAAADCTGHGVPGAIVSMICHNSLNRALLEYEITDPGKLLNITRELVISTFERSDSTVKDGMDISLACLNKKTNELLWAGANNPLWIISNTSPTNEVGQDGKAQLKEYSPNKQPIGKIDNPKPFTTQKIQLFRGDMIYLFTDGFADQFGGPKGKKFKYKQMKEIISEISKFSTDEQKMILSKKFEEWKGKLEQVDDVCVLGFRI